MPLLSFLITPAEQRTPYTRYNVIFALLPFVAHALAAHIRYRRPSTSLCARLAFAVVSVVITLRVNFAHYKQPSSAADRPMLDVAVDAYCGAFALSSIISVLDMLFTRNACEFDVKGASEYRRWMTTVKEDTAHPLERPLCFPGTRVPLELDVLWSLRGLGYERGVSQRGVAYEAGYAALMAARELRQRPLHEARTVKWRHVGRALRVCVQCYVIVNVCDSFLRNPSVLPTTPTTTIDDARRGILGAFGPWVMTVLQCVVLVSLIQLISTSCYLIALTSTPAYDAPITISRWQPFVMGQPHRSTSIRTLWSDEWHALLRRTFVVGGYRPARSLATALRLPRRVAMAFGTFGAFFVSGVLHELCLEAVAPYQQRIAVVSPHRLGFGARHFYTTRFFLAMAFGVCLEDVWQSTLERHVAALLKMQRVSGRLRSVLGWTWCMAYMTYFGHGLIDVWLEHGMAVGASSAQLSRPVVDVILSMFA